MAQAAGPGGTTTQPQYNGPARFGVMPQPGNNMPMPPAQTQGPVGRGYVGGDIGAWEKTPERRGPGAMAQDPNPRSYAGPAMPPTDIAAQLMQQQQQGQQWDTPTPRQQPGQLGQPVRGMNPNTPEGRPAGITPNYNPANATAGQYQPTQPGQALPQVQSAPTPPTLTPPGSTPLGTGPAPNINVQAAQGITEAGQASLAGTTYQPGQVQAGQLAGTDMSAYMNPYQQNVIDQSIADINRQGANMQNQLGASAGAAGAFGGSRHGIAEGELGRNMLQSVADTTGTLRHQGYQNAQLAANQDISNTLNADQFNVGTGLQGAQHNLNSAAQLANVSNLGFGMGQTITGNLAADGQSQQVMDQALIDAAAGMGAAQQAHPATGLGYGMAALGAAPVPQQTTTSNDPGLIDLLAVGAGFLASDERLKTNIKKMGELKSGLNIYKWDWKEGAEKFGANMNHTIGVIAQEVKKRFPDAVEKMDNGYYAVKYSELR